MLFRSNISEYRNIFDQLIIDTIRNKRNTTPASVLDYQNFIKKNYSNMNPRSLRYLFARIEKFICEHTKQSMQNDVEYISTKTGNKTGYHIEHILSHNQTNKKYFDSTCPRAVSVSLSFSRKYRRKRSLLSQVKRLRMFFC